MEKPVESEHMKGLKPLPEKKVREGKKHFILAALLVIIAAAFWYNAYSFLTEGIQFETGRLIQLLMTLLLFGSLNGLVGVIGFTFHDWTTRIYVYFFAVATHFIFFGLNFYTIMTVVLLWLFWMRYGRNTGWEERERIHFHAIKILSHTLGTVISFSIFALAFAYFGVVAQNEARSIDVIDAFSETATTAAVLTLESFVENFDKDMTLDAFLDQYAGEQIKALFPGDLLPANLESILQARDEQPDGAPHIPLAEETLQEFRETLLQKFGIHAEGSDPISVVLTDIVRARIREAIEPYQKYVPPVLAISLFLALSAFGALYFWVSVGMGWLMTKALFLVHLLKIEERSKITENLIIE
ncbi:MAG: hypothetical protein WCV86_04765 [Patescibacteria group bacterium]|jgi:hypothetical protein